MSRTPQDHAREIFNDLRKQAIKKYMAGAAEHGGNLWEVSLPQMIGFAKEEVIDQGSYLWTIEENLQNLRLLLGELFEAWESSEEPPTNGESAIIAKVRSLLDI